VPNGPTYFHATVDTHSRGDFLRIAGGSHSYGARAAAAGNAWVDPLLDGRPAALGKPLRTTSVYCCPDLACCAKFADTEAHLAGRYRIYEVVAHGRVHAAPMLLVGRISRRKAPDVVGMAIADEYWQHTKEWRYVEVLADALEVVREVAKPDPFSIMCGGACYDDDYQLAVQLGW
jgi:hypothetical protein